MIFKVEQVGHEFTNHGKRDSKTFKALMVTVPGNEQVIHTAVIRGNRNLDMDIRRGDIIAAEIDSYAYYDGINETLMEFGNVYFLTQSRAHRITNV